MSEKEESMYYATGLRNMYYVSVKRRELYLCPESTEEEAKKDRRWRQSWGRVKTTVTI